MRLKTPLIIILCLFVSACTDRPQPMGKPLPDISFAHLQALSFGGATHVKQSFVPSQSDAGQELVIPLTVLLNRYAANRFYTSQSDPAAVFFDIERASVIKKTHEGSVAGMFGGEDTYEADIVLSLTPQNPNALPKSYTISLNEKVRVVQSWSLAEKEAAQMKFLEGIIQEIDQQINIIADRNGY